MKILVTGGNGYIGAHVVKQLTERGHEVISIDENVDQNNISKYAKVLEHDLTKSYEGQDLNVDAIVHLAAYISVEESTQDPLKYYHNNLLSTYNLLTNKKFKTKHFLFASTGAAFDPKCPYATSKVVCEDVVKQLAAGKYSIFRFFNVSGLDAEFSPTGTPTHLIRRAAMAAAGKIDKLTIFGSDFETRDGTCVRDYVHVVDLANAICNVAENGPVNSPYECIGSGTGYTVKEIVKAMEKVVGKTLNIDMGPRRAGDAPSLLTPEVSKFMKPNHDIYDMCKSAYEREMRTL